jgi:hypothetical protein
MCSLPEPQSSHLKLGNRNYLIQQNWVNKTGGSCALTWDD